MKKSIKAAVLFEMINRTTIMAERDLETARTTEEEDEFLFSLECCKINFNLAMDYCGNALLYSDSLNKEGLRKLREYIKDIRHNQDLVNSISKIFN